MTVHTVEVPCPDCRLSSVPGNLDGGYWECPSCRRSYFLRRCAGCQAVSHVGAQQSWHQRWKCVWCEHANSGFSRLGDPAAATVGDLVADISRRGLVLAPGDAERQTQPIPILVIQPGSAPLPVPAMAAGAGSMTMPPPPATVPLPAMTVPPPRMTTPPPLVPGLAAGPGQPAAPWPAPAAVAGPDPASPPGRRWRGRRTAVLAAAVLIILMAGPALVLAAHASHMRHPGPAGQPGQQASTRQISVSAGPVRAVYLHNAPGQLTIVGAAGGAVRLTGQLRWTGRPPQRDSSVNRATQVLRLSYRCAAGSPCTGNYRLAVPAGTAVILSQPSGRVILDGLAGPLRITAANVNVTATGLRSPALAATITSGQLTASFATAPQQVSVALSSAQASLQLPGNVPYAVSTQVTSGNVQVGVPQSASSGHTVTVRVNNGQLQLLPSG